MDNVEIINSFPMQQEKTTPAELILKAITEKTDLDKLEKLLALQERYDANEARKAYYKAMTAFKANPPKIDKDKQVGYSTSRGKVGYSHATLANVTDKITSELSKYGLSASWRTSQSDKVTVTCVISHYLGHSEETSLSAPADDSGSKNNIQAIGSTITYLQRYSLLAITGLATHDQNDDDAQSACGELISSEEIESLKKGLKDVGSSEDKLLNYLNVKSFEDIKKSDYQKALSAIEARKKVKNANS
jgi:hypothetical protein